MGMVTYKQRDHDFLRRYLDLEDRVNEAWRRYGEGDLSAGNSGWISLALGAGWTSEFPTTAQWRICNDLVVLRGQIENTSWDGSEALIATLPSDAWPQAQTRLWATTGLSASTQDTAVLVRVTVDGEVYATRAAGGTGEDVWLSGIQYPYG